jgi:hypothetical protein
MDIMQGKYQVDSKWVKMVIKFYDYHVEYSHQEQALLLGISQEDLTRLYEFSRVGGYLDWALIEKVEASILRKIALAKIETLQAFIKLPDKQLQLF